MKPTVQLKMDVEPKIKEKLEEIKGLTNKPMKEIVSDLVEKEYDILHDEVKDLENELFKLKIKLENKLSNSTGEDKERLEKMLKVVKKSLSEFLK